jgi:Ribonuclease G/E
MPSEILVNAGAGETRAAWVVDGVLEGYAARSLLGPRGAAIGDIYLGRVLKVMDAVEAAFVEIGHDRPGFLALKDAKGARLHEGMALAVAVTREASGDKGPRLAAVAHAAPPGARPPLLLQEGPGIAARAIAAWADEDTLILVDDARAAAALGAAGHAVTHRAGDLFEPIAEQVAALAAPRVALPCGGFLTIEKTRALTAMDVDSGGFRAAGGRAETARIVNREAAREAGRQIRLRGIGGIVVVDFIQAEELPVALLRESLGADVPVEIVPVPALGLVTLARRHGALGHGGGTAADAVAQAVLRQLERSARAAPGRPLTVRAAPAVTALLAGAAVRAGLDRRGVGQVAFVAEAGRGGDFDVATG